MSSVIIEPKELWLYKVKSKYSGSESTQYKYRLAIGDFEKYFGITLKDIKEKWKNIRRTRNVDQMDEYCEYWNQVLIKYQMYMENELKYARGTICSRLVAIQSAFKHLKIPIEVDIPQWEVTFHNQDITTEELGLILRHASVRDRAFFSMMAQGGFRPITLCRLKYKAIKEDFEKGVVPCRVIVPKEIAKGKYGGYFSFIGDDTVEYLKEYFRERGLPSDDDYIFKPIRKVKYKIVSKNSMATIFQDLIRKLGLQDEKYYNSKKTPKPLRLYCLRKWFRNKASPAGYEYVHYWMGHVLKRNDENYLGDIEEHRRRYRELALPNLRIGSVDESVAMKTLKEELDNAMNLLQKYQKVMPLKELEEIEQWLGGDTIPVALGKLVRDVTELKRKA